MAIDPSSSSKSNLFPNRKKDKSMSSKSNEPKENEPQNGVPKRKKCPGIRVVGGRIYDSENGRTCHQCRQKTKDFVAVCRGLRNNKPCTLMFCHKCLLNRYGERAEEVSLQEDWTCPKCKGICNCSFCMKKRGHQPTGILAHTAKANGYSSVSEMLQVSESTHLSNGKLVNDVGASPRKRPAMEKDAVIISPRKPGKENSYRGNVDSHLYQASPSDTVMETAKKAKLEGSCKTDNHIGSSDAEDTTSLKRKTLEVQAKTDNGNHPLESDAVSDGKKLRNPKQHRVDGVRDDTLMRRVSPRKHTQSNGTLNNNVTGVADGNALPERKMSEAQEMKSMTNPKQNHDEKKLQNKKQASGMLATRTSPRKLKESNKSMNKGNSEVYTAPLDQDPVKANFVFTNTVEKRENLNNCDVQLKATGECMDIHGTYQRVQWYNFDDDIQLPHGAELTSIDGIEIPPEDIGKALQFLEFCAAFGKILDVKKGHPECVLKDLIHSRTSRRGKYSATVQFHIHLISMIQEEREGSVLLSPSNGKQLWVQALKECISESESILSSLPLDHLSKRADGYDNLKSSEKLQILNVLCDEVLGTAKVRNWIDDQVSKHSERAKEQKEKVAGARNKKKSLKQKIQDEIAKAIIQKNGSFLSISEQEAIIAQIKHEAAQAHSEVLESQGMLLKTNQAPDAVRTEPVYLGTDGRVYWRLKSLSKKSDIIVQDVGTGNSSMCDEKWFSFNQEQEKMVQDSINVLRRKRQRAEKFPRRQPCPNNELVTKP